MSNTFQFPQEAGAQDFPQGFCAAGFLPERNVTTFDCHASQPVALLDPSILEESWAPGRLLLLTSSCSKSANKLDKCSFGFLTNPEIKTMKHILKPEVTAQIINRCLSHHIS